MKKEGILLVDRQQAVYRCTETFRQKQPVKCLTVDEVLIGMLFTDLFGAGPQTDRAEQGNIPVLAIGE